MRAFGGSINTMTLGGMAIAIGALVDDAIIDVENVFRRLRENGQLPAEPAQDDLRRSSSTPAWRSAARSSSPRSSSCSSSCRCSSCRGVEGRLLQPLGFAYVVSLAASLVVALTVTPVLCSLLLPTSQGGPGEQGGRRGALAQGPLRADPRRRPATRGRPCRGGARAGRPCRGRPRPRRARLPPGVQRRAR